MRKAFTGGACQGSDMQGGMQANALTNFMDDMINQDAMARQRAEGYHSQLSMEQMQMNMMMEAQFSGMQQQEQMRRQFDMMQMQVNSPFQEMLNRGPDQAVMNSLWDSTASVKQGMQPMGMQENMRQPWMRPAMMMNRMPMYTPTPLQQQNLITPQREEESKAEVKDNSEAKASTDSMIDVLSSSDNPKFRNSKFLKFLKKINQGAYEIKDNDIVKDDAKLQLFRVQEATRLEEEKQRAVKEESEAEQIRQGLTNKQEALNKDLFQQMWEQDEDNELTEEAYEKMMQQWFQEGVQNEQQMMHMQRMQQAMFEQQFGANNNYAEPVVEVLEDIRFQDENPFLGQSELLAKAKELEEAGELQRAILCLEADVQNEGKENPESWALLGMLYQQDDQDTYAIIALKKAFDIDPYDLETLLNLGISCTNEKEHTYALRNLKQWLKSHPDYTSLPDVHSDNIDLEEVVHQFQEAAKLRQNDSKVLLALGVLHFLSKRAEIATQYFEQAVRINPTDHTLWNKYGAALANSARYPEAMLAYDQALELRPAYTRAWVNKAMAHNSQIQYEAAAHYYVNALTLNPGAEHIWNYMNSQMTRLDRFEWKEKCIAKDLKFFQEKFGPVINPQQLPRPNLEKMYDHPIWNQ